MVKPASTSFEFDGMRIDPANRRLVREDQIVRLTPKAFDLLLLLVEHRGRVVERDEIIGSIWPGTSVEEANLTQTIYMLRKALRSRPDAASYIETIPKIGYTFTGEVQVLSIPPETAAGDDSTEEGPSNLVEQAGPALRAIGQPGRRFKAAFAMVFALLCLGLLGLFLSMPRKPPGAIGIRSIAVLPFKPIHIEPNDQYLGLGMADALITRLSSLRDIVVRPTDAVRRYDGFDRDSVEAGRELAVEGVLSGSVQRLGSRLRVTLQLVQVKNGAPLWSGQFDEESTDVFALEDSMSRQIAGALAVKLSGQESKRLVGHGTENAAAFELYLKGRYYWGQNTPATVQKAIECFQQAINLDHSYALAYVGIADSYAVAASGLRPAERFPRAREAASRAISLDEDLAQAHASVGYILYKYYWEWSTAELEFRRAIELNPNDSTAHHYYGEYLCLTGRFEEGLTELKQASELEPLSSTTRADIGIALYRARRYSEAIEQLKSTIERDSGSWMAHFYLALAYEAAGMYDEAVAEALSSRKLSGQFEDSVPSLRDAYARGGWNAFLRKYLAVIQEHSISEYVPPYWIAVLYVRLGDTDKALEWLSKSLEERDDGPLALKVDPTYDPVRSDARFQQLVQKVGFVPQAGRPPGPSSTPDKR